MRLFASLTNRIFVATAALAVMGIAVAVYRINVAVTAQAENELRRGLVEAANLLEEHRTTLFEHFSREARLIADVSQLKAAMTTGDPPTVQPIADEYQRRIGSDLLVVTDPRGRVLAQAGRIRMPPAEGTVADTIAQAASGRECVALWQHRDGVLQVVAVPSLVGPELVGTLTVGTSLDEAALARYKALTNSEIAFAIGDRVRASTLPPDANASLTGLIPLRDISRVQLGDAEYAALSRPLSLTGSEGAASSASAPPITALILRSRTERLRLLSAVHRELAVTAVLAVLAATILSYGIARTITRPLGTITAAMREMAATGDLTRRIPPPAGRWNDEDARLLAHTFNSMTDSIVRFQRESTQKERLSSLGRLSTVVAHEIRNPLMIIKAALRPLKTGAPSADAVRSAATDIDEEVVRLNRIVSEVLDFAKPIKFELSAVDVNALCQDAARAATPDGADPPLVLDLETGMPRVTGDAERLRLALVNILTNARHAIDADPRGVRQTPAITLTTRHLGDKVRIQIRDRGPGIPDEDLSRIFDPFFTTRRTGTGLGLAISRNIVEGLGGTIIVANRPAGGTEVTIELRAE